MRLLGGAEMLGVAGTGELQRGCQSRVPVEGLTALLAPYLSVMWDREVGVVVDEVAV